MAKQKPTYNESIAELELILSDLENNNTLTMDVISEKVKRAASLLETCKSQLHELDTELEKILQQID